MPVTITSVQSMQISSLELIKVDLMNLIGRKLVMQATSNDSKMISLRRYISSSFGVQKREVVVVPQKTTCCSKRGWMRQTKLTIVLKNRTRQTHLAITQVRVNVTSPLVAETHSLLYKPRTISECRCSLCRKCLANTSTLKTIKCRSTYFCKQVMILQSEDTYISEHAHIHKHQLSKSEQ